MTRSTLPFLVLGVLLSGSLATAEAAIPKGATITLETVATGLASPLGVRHAGDGSGRLFVYEQSGLIRVVDAGGTLLPTPFLDVSAFLPTLNSGFDERGLLGLAFHPDYASNGRFFVRHSAPRAGSPGEPCFGTSRGCHEELLVEYQVSAGDPDVADPASRAVLLAVDEPEFNHNAGDLAFGPDGYLYIPLGDGGGGGDAHGSLGNGQDITTLLGSVLRIDVDGTPAPGKAYAIPADNPFVGTAGEDEIYAFGFRNPFRISFDDGPGGDGTLWVADVGQALYEEIDRVVLGGNYGWRTREGYSCFNTSNFSSPLPSCSSTGPSGEPLLDPVAVYDHSEGISVIGGYVYRGPAPSLHGQYVFGEYTGRLFHLEETSPATWEIREFRLGVADDPYGYAVKGFGEDETGRLYVCAGTSASPFGSGGRVDRLVFPDAGGIPGDGGAVARLRAVPTPFHGSTRVTWADAAPGTGEARVYGIAGRAVRDLGPVRTTAAGLEVAWDGRDDAGRRLPPGAYFLRLRDANGAARTVRLLLAP